MNTSEGIVIINLYKKTDLGTPKAHKTKSKKQKKYKYKSDLTEQMKWNDYSGFNVLNYSQSHFKHSTFIMKRIMETNLKNTMRWSNWPSGRRCRPNFMKKFYDVKPQINEFLQENSKKLISTLTMVKLQLINLWVA